MDDNYYSDLMTRLAMYAFAADHDQPDCLCEVTTRYEPATPENGAIRAAYLYTVDPKDCPIERHRNPWGS